MIRVDDRLRDEMVRVGLSTEVYDAEGQRIGYFLTPEYFEGILVDLAEQVGDEAGPAVAASPMPTPPSRTAVNSISKA